MIKFQGVAVTRFSLVISLLVFGCSTVPKPSNTELGIAFTAIENGFLIYKGVITRDANERAFKTYNKAQIKPHTLLISSSGGDINLGIALGNWVKENELNVEVKDFCASSCANYIFPAGRLKYLSKDSVLIWHGSAWQTHWDIDDGDKARFQQSIQSMRVKETEFFAKILVDNILPVYGQSKFNLWDKVLSWIGLGPIGFDYSISDLENLGVTGINLKDNEWNWRAYKPNKKHLVRRFSLTDDYRFTINRFVSKTDY